MSQFSDRSGEFTSPHGGVKPPLPQTDPPSLRGPLANYWKHEFGNHHITCRLVTCHSSLFLRYCRLCATLFSSQVATEKGGNLL